MCQLAGHLTALTHGAGPNVTDDLRDGGLGDAALAVWTTTPWTMPANLAVAVNDRMNYSLVQVRALRALRAVQPEVGVLRSRRRQTTLLAHGSLGKQWAAKAQGWHRRAVG